MGVHQEKRESREQEVRPEVGLCHGDESGTFDASGFEGLHGVEGSVRLEFDVDTDGSVLDPYVVESSPAGVFDRAAIKAVRKFLYQPPTYNGTSVKVNNVQIDLTFKLAN